jgi:hypothetical protein
MLGDPFFEVVHIPKIISKKKGEGVRVLDYRFWIDKFFFSNKY